VKGRRDNGEGSIYPQREGLFAAYVWVTTPAGQRRRKYVYGKTREIVREKWLRLHEQARKAPIATATPTLAEYLGYWLHVVVEPNLRPLPAATYETLVRLYITPTLGQKGIDRLSVRDIRLWINTLRETCQCCAQGKDAKRQESKRRCCAIGKCCNSVASDRTIRDARGVLRSALSNAMTEELISRNVAAMIPVRVRRTHRPKPWSVEEARQFLEEAKACGDPLYAAYVLILVLGLRKGEVLGLTWENVNLGAAEVDIGWQLQRVRRQLLHRETKTDASEATLPLPDLCVAVLRDRRKVQDVERRAAAPTEEWDETGLVFTGRYGSPVDPRHFNRRFDAMCDRAGVRRIRVHDTRHTCASLLAALDVHPRVAMAVLRHSNIAVTMDIYTDVPPAVTRDALKRLGAQLGGA
jgi:integrase